jgi:hypothetical protein
MTISFVFYIIIVVRFLGTSCAARISVFPYFFRFLLPFLHLNLHLPSIRATCRWGCSAGCSVRWRSPVSAKNPSRNPPHPHHPHLHHLHLRNQAPTYSSYGICTRARPWGCTEEAPMFPGLTRWPCSRLRVDLRTCWRRSRRGQRFTSGLGTMYG